MAASAQNLRSLYRRFLREMPTGKLRVSLRSRDPLDVSIIAQTFGGGGTRVAQKD